jgi:hypothetical protein
MKMVLMMAHSANAKMEVVVINIIQIGGINR